MSAWGLYVDGKPISDEQARWAIDQAKKIGEVKEQQYPNGKLWVRHGQNIVKQVDGKWYLCKP